MQPASFLIDIKTLIGIGLVSVVGAGLMSVFGNGRMANLIQKAGFFAAFTVFLYMAIGLLDNFITAYQRISQFFN